MSDGMVLVMVGVIEVLLLAVMSAIVFRRLGFPFTLLVQGTTVGRLVRACPPA
jgi:hypothetical protein